MSVNMADMTNEKYSIVLVLKQYTHHQGKQYNNLERFMKIGMKSYKKFMKIDDIQTFFVIVPSSDVATISKELHEKFPEFPWKIIDEEILVSSKIPSGWARQQTAKLAISMLINTDTYLIVDDDTYLTKPFSAKDMYDPVSNKLIFNRTNIDFPFFFLWSAQVLHMDFDKVQDAECHMAITPEIFVTSVVKDIVKWLVNQYGSNKEWQLYIANHKFTEYCIYWNWLIENNLTNTYYDLNSSKQLYAYATTNSEQDMPKQVNQSFTDNANHWFSFVQSSIDMSMEKVRQEVMKYIKN